MIFANAWFGFGSRPATDGTISTPWSCDTHDLGGGTYGSLIKEERGCNERIMHPSSPKIFLQFSASDERGGRVTHVQLCLNPAHLTFFPLSFAHLTAFCTPTTECGSNIVLTSCSTVNPQLLNTVAWAQVRTPEPSASNTSLEGLNCGTGVSSTCLSFSMGE